MYNLILSTKESTVVSAYQPAKNRLGFYQSEKDLENEFVKILTEQGYEYADIHTGDELIANLRKQLEALNNIKFTENEWEMFFKNNIANDNEGIVEKTIKIQKDHIQVFRREDGSAVNVFLIDKKNIHRNRLQVIRQFEENRGKYGNRYDVTILINGLPIVQVELKRRGVALKEAFNQIERYQNESFWAGTGLYEYIQIFVISNGTTTKYYSNSTRANHLAKRGKKTSNSFEFTSYWADGNNKTIPDLVDFAKTFFARHTLLNVIVKYCVFTEDNMLLVMRPYQIVATERILNQIEISSNYKKTGTVEAGGYIWQSPGSGKTLESFKTAQLAAELPYIDKVLFVVDRKDLDYQTIKEYERFQKGAANGNRNTAILQKQLENTASRIIVTTIQKLDVFISKNKTHPVYNKHVVIIFDECHRSQFGQMHSNIIKHFKNYHLFGFTGTPIFSSNAGANKFTTEQVFGKRLHTYTIVDAINDGNVLPFRVDFVSTVKRDGEPVDVKVEKLDTDEVMSSTKRIGSVCDYILDHFNQKTMRNIKYDFKGRKVDGFNSILATESITACKKYYKEIGKRISERGLDLKIATIFSFAPNEDEESFDVDGLDVSSREFLESAIADYNRMFSVNFSTGNFHDYYKDLSMRVKNREIDILIVVNMFLTGFDATTLNTIWVDKDLRMHGLIQAFSRTNRILNSVKTFGNVVCFRDLEAEINEAIALFGDKNARSIVMLKSYNEYYNDEKTGYKPRIMELTSRFPLGVPIIGEQNKKDFLVLFGNILKVRNILSSFDDFEGNEILSNIDLQDYMGMYHDTYEELKRKDIGKESFLEDVVFEAELVKQIEVNIDYIMALIEKYKTDNENKEEILDAISKAIGSSTQLRSKKDLIDEFIENVNAGVDDIAESWKGFVKSNREKDLEKIIKEEGLVADAVNKYVANVFKDGVIKTVGCDVDAMMPGISRFGRTDGDREKKKEKMMERLNKFFEKYSGV